MSLEEYREAHKSPIVIVLDNIRSMNNVGSAFRTGDAFLVEKVILTGITAQPPHREIHKTALVDSKAELGKNVSLDLYLQY